MLPPTTASPPYFFTPRRRPAESRPLRDEPPAFLCAMAKCSLRSGSADRHDLEDRVLLAMAVAPAIIVPPPLLEDDDLLALGLGDDLGGDGKLARRLQRVAVAGEQDIVERDGVAGGAVDLLDCNLVPGGDAI